MRMVSCKAAVVAIFAVALMPIHAALGDDRIQVVAFGDSLLVLLRHKFLTARAFDDRRGAAWAS